MIKEKVTIILGAGASYPYGFPLGGELKDMILDQILSHHPIHEKDQLGPFLKQFGYPDDIQKEFAVQLKESMQPSVDAFLFERSEFVDIGKLSIAANLICFEKKYNLLSKSDGGESNKNKWYTYLLNLMGNRSEFKSNNLSIITFNYDRSLEYFLYYALRARFNLSEQEVTDYVKSIPIIHVYGQLGEALFLNSNGRDYSNLLDYGNLKKSAESISLIYEKNNVEVNSENLKTAHNTIEETDLLIFLGFGYLEENIKRLKLEQYYKRLQIVGTFYGMKAGEISRVKYLFEQYSVLQTSQGIKVYELDVLEFLRQTNYLR